MVRTEGPLTVHEGRLELYSVGQAAEYLGIARVTVKKHIYRTKQLVPDYDMGKMLLFTRETLDRFKLRPRPQGGWPRREQPVSQ